LTDYTYNIVDFLAPVSSLKQDVFYLGDFTYLISWSGHDEINGSGLKDYTIYISDSAIYGYQPWKINIADTFSTFKGEPGRTYYFYSVARDSVDNIENFSGTYDLVLKNVGIMDNINFNSGYLQIYPNPSNCRTMVEFYNPQHKTYHLKVFNLYGSTVLEKNNISVGNFEFDGSTLSPGIYFLRLQGDNVQVGKLLIK